MKKALLVGINEYPAPNQLQGCVPDVLAAADFLTSRCGFLASEIRLLTDKRATAAAQREHLEWLADGWPVDADPSSDKAAYWNSSHGSQLVDRDEKGDVVAIHDCICPVDFDFTHETAITDDDFMKIFANIPAGVVFRWISDSCHSGDLARVFVGFYDKARQFEMPVDYAWRIRTAKELQLQPRGFSKSIEHLQGAFISGCRSDQTSADACIDNRPCGALTHALLFVLQADTHLSIPLQQIVVSVNSYLRNAGYDQEPQLRGTDGEKTWLGS